MAGIVIGDPLNKMGPPAIPARFTSLTGSDLMQTGVDHRHPAMVSPRDQDTGEAEEDGLTHHTITTTASNNRTLTIARYGIAPIAGEITGSATRALKQAKDVRERGEAAIAGELAPRVVGRAGGRWPPRILRRLPSVVTTGWPKSTHGFVNGVSNAVNFTPTDNRVTVDLPEADGFARFVVSDTREDIARAL
jgi:hypothetical protein